MDTMDGITVALTSATLPSPVLPEAFASSKAELVVVSDPI